MITYTTNVSDFYNLNHNQVVAFVKSCNVSTDAIQDITQQFYAELQPALSHYDCTKSPFPTYICSIISRKISDHRKTEWQQEQVRHNSSILPTTIEESIDTQLYIDDLIGYCQRHGKRSTSVILSEIQARITDSTSTYDRSSYYRAIKGFLSRE